MLLDGGWVLGRVMAGLPTWGGYRMSQHLHSPTLGKKGIQMKLKRERRKVNN